MNKREKSIFLKITSLFGNRRDSEPARLTSVFHPGLKSGNCALSTSTAPYWPSTTKYQSIPTYTDHVPPSTNQYHLLLTQCHHISTSTASYWPSTTKYQPVPTYTVFPWGLQTPAQFTPGPRVLFQSVFDYGTDILGTFCNKNVFLRALESSNR